MIIREEQMDLFSVPQGYYLAHCISADFALGAGIAKQFNEVYDMRLKLNNIYDFFDNSVGLALVIDNVFNLVTKEKSFHKPTYESLRATLNDMKNMMEQFYITKVAMPLIGCGLDRLEWDNVREIICEVFQDVDCEILVCRL